MGRRVIGVDAARYGGDKTVFALGTDDRLEELHIYEKQSVTVSAGYLENFAKRAAETRIEMDSGLGASMYDILKVRTIRLNRP